MQSLLEQRKSLVKDKSIVKGEIKGKTMRKNERKETDNSYARLYRVYGKVHPFSTPFLLLKYTAN